MSGLQTSLEWSGIVACARSIASMTEETNTLKAGSNYSADTDSSTVTAVDACDESSSIRRYHPSAVVRSKLHRSNMFLAFLGKNIARLMKELAEPPAAVKSSSQGSSNLAKLTMSWLPIRSLFGEQVAVLQEEEKQASTSPREYLAKLVDIPWLAVIASPTELHMCMPSRTADDGTAASSCSCAAPVKTRPRADAWFCSATHYISNAAVSETLSTAFGWSEPVPARDIATQLSEVAKRYMQLKASKSLSCDLEEIRLQLAVMVPQFYQKLNLSAREAHGSARDIVNVLETAAWIWVGDGFVPINKVASAVSINASPYLYQLPQDLKVHKSLLALFNIQSTFTYRDYLQVLRQMATECSAIDNSLLSYDPKIKPDKSPLSFSSLKPLADTQIDLAVSLVTQISMESSGLDPLNVDVFVPDINGCLLRSAELVNDDVPWLSGPEYANVRVGCRFIHPNISSAVAEKLGVKSLRLLKINTSANQAFFSDADTGTDAEGNHSGVAAHIESFGQSESITNRLRTILDLYPDGNPVLSELVQNADDAVS